MEILRNSLLILSLIFCSNFFICYPCNAQEKTLNLNLENADLRTVLISIAKTSNINLILDNSISGSISLHLQNIEAETALKLISNAAGYNWQHYNSNILISKNINSSQNLNNLSIIKLKYLNAKECQTILKPLLGETKISIDSTANCLIFSGNQTAQSNIKLLLTQLDIPSKQISLDVKIIAVNKEHTEVLGVQWLWSELPATTNSSNNDHSSEQSLPGKLKLSSTQGLNYQATLDAQINSGQAKILANPKITTLPGREAKIFIGDHIPVVTEKNNNGTITQNTEYIDAGIKLIYTAYINSDDYITASVHTEVSTPTLIASLRNYKISTRQANTTVRLKNGETLVIAGLIGQEDLQKITKIPLLSNIPFFGNLFKHQEQHKQSTEVIIFITSKILD